MVKVKTPLFSIAAHGTVGTVLTYSKRKTTNQVRYQRKQRVYSSEGLYVSRDKFFAGQILYALLTLPEKIFWALVAKFGWAPLTIDDLYVPSADGHRGAMAIRNHYLPTLLIDKGVPRTNQAMVYVMGDDGTYQTGVEGMKPRFVDNNDGTITDLATGLMWVADPSAIGEIWGTEGNPESMTWDDAVANSLALDYAGHNDWRLPNIKELESLVDYSKSNPAIDSSKFPNTKSDDYWSGSMTNFGCDNEFFPDFGPGNKSWEQDLTKKKYVRPVRKAPTGHRPVGRHRAK